MGEMPKKTEVSILALYLIARLACLELVDTLRDIQQLSTRLPAQSGPSFSEIAPLALPAQLTFFSTGHEAVIVTLQWETAFVLTATLSVFSPLTVVSNSLSPIFVVALSAPSSLGDVAHTPTSTTCWKRHRHQKDVEYRTRF
jgi:phosphatidylinositol glycan class O